MSTSSVRTTKIRNVPTETRNVTINSKGTVMSIQRSVHLINEALSRARMRRPQTANSEAIRPARQIMVNAHREHDRLLGL